MSLSKDYEQQAKKKLAEQQAKLNRLKDEVALYVMEEFVAAECREIIRKHINEDVYGVGSPLVYKRRREFDGLIDHANIRTTATTSPVTLTFANTAKSAHPLHDISLSDLIEGGYGSKDSWYNQPRPFMDKANEEIKSSNYIAKLAQEKFIETLRELLK